MAISADMVNAVWKRVNWNAKNSLGEYVCRDKMNCYTPDAVRDILDKLETVIKGGTELKGDNIGYVADRIIALGSTETRGRISAVLLEYYYEDMANPKTNWTIIGIGAGVLALGIIYLATAK